MHVRVQTWLPLTIDVYVNGREWLGVLAHPWSASPTRKWTIASQELADFPRAQRASDELTTRGLARAADGVGAPGVMPLVGLADRLASGA